MDAPDTTKSSGTPGNDGHECCCASRDANGQGKRVIGGGSIQGGHSREQQTFSRGRLPVQARDVNDHHMGASMAKQIQRTQIKPQIHTPNGWGRHQRSLARKQPQILYSLRIPRRGYGRVNNKATKIHWPLGPEKWTEGRRRMVRMEHHL